MPGLEFRLLGPLLVSFDDIAIPIPRGRQRAVLAALLLSRNQVVSLDNLAWTLWGDRPPPRARTAVQNYVMRLRRSLGTVGATRIGTHTPGYVIRTAGGELDITQFECYISNARAAASHEQWYTVSSEARAAIALWRGEPLADVESETLLKREVPRLAEMRLKALETYINAELHLGHHSEVIVELHHLADTHPLREHLQALLMLALYREGRQAEALAVSPRRSASARVPS